MSYAGEITPVEVWEKLLSDKSAYLVDVRTQAEWSYVGVPALQEDMSPMIGQEWQVFPTMSVDPNFGAVLSKRLDDVGAAKSSPLFFLCRSGVRSLAAARAMTALGYEQCFNVTGGFEGDHDEHRHRGTVNGWKASDLPWQQG